MGILKDDLATKHLVQSGNFSLFTSWDCLLWIWVFPFLPWFTEKHKWLQHAQQSEVYFYVEYQSRWSRHQPRHRRYRNPVRQWLESTSWSPGYGKSLITFYPMDNLTIKFLHLHFNLFYSKACVCRSFRRVWCTFDISQSLMLRILWVTSGRVCYFCNSHYMFYSNNSIVANCFQIF